MDCAICLNLLNNPETVPCCLKSFCSQCLKSWVNVRNCCPLCIAPLGSDPTNKLSHQATQEFDNGGLMLENDLTAILQKMSFLRMMYASKRDISNNFKTHFPKAHLAFVEEGLRNIEENIEIVQLSIEQQDRVTAAATIQTIAEQFLNVEAILMGESTVGFEDDYDSEEQDYEDDYDYEMEEEIYIKNDKEKYKNAAKQNGKKRVNALM